MGAMASQITASWLFTQAFDQAQIKENIKAPRHWPLWREFIGNRRILRAKDLGPVLLTLLRHVARILANGRAAFFESCDAIGWNSCDVSQNR